MRGHYVVCVILWFAVPKHPYLFDSIGAIFHDIIIISLTHNAQLSYNLIQDKSKNSIYMGEKPEFYDCLM